MLGKHLAEAVQDVEVKGGRYEPPVLKPSII